MKIVPFALLIIGVAFAACRPAVPYGIFHEVESKQTLYRICKTYKVQMQEVAELNGIDDPSQIRIGQRIFIPGAEYERKVDRVARAMNPGAPKYPTTKPPKSNRPKPPKEYDPGKTITKSKGRFIWPVQGKLSSKFGIRDGQAHDGIDVVAKEGTPIIAADDGKVIYAGDGLSGYGNLIIVKHEGYFATVYAHNDENLVKVGQFVEKGQKVATVGETGRATSPHLHFELREKNKPRNPLFYLP